MSCLHALIECVRQSVLQNPVFGHLLEVLIHLSQSNQVNLPVLLLLDSCLFTCSRVVYTQASCKIIHISTDECHMFHHCPQPLGKQSLWMKCICSRTAQTNSPCLQGKKSTDNLELKYKVFCLLHLVLFLSFHFKCSALGFRTFVCPSE